MTQTIVKYTGWVTQLEYWGCTLYLHNQGPYETLRFVQKIIQKSKTLLKTGADYWLLASKLNLTQKIHMLTLSFLAFLQKLLIVALGMLFGSLPIFFKVFLAIRSIARKSASALAW